MGIPQVLGIPVTEQLVSRWRGWFAPPEQPFRTDLLSPDLRAAIPHRNQEPTTVTKPPQHLRSGLAAGIGGCNAEPPALNAVDRDPQLAAEEVGAHRSASRSRSFQSVGSG